MHPGQRVKNGPTARVLIVDDNSDAAHTTGMWLELSGHQVDVLTDGTQCLPRLELFLPDVLLLDIAMPTISGYDLAEKIRSEARYDRMAIIAISGFADALHARQSLASGCNQHLIKPVDLHVLNDVIDQEVEKLKTVAPWRRSTSNVPTVNGADSQTIRPETPASPLIVPGRAPSASAMQIKYAEWIRLDDSGILHVDVQLADCAALLPFLRASNLEFDCTQLESRGEQVTFEPGTLVGRVHAVLARFDELNGRR